MTFPHVCIKNERLSPALFRLRVSAGGKRFLAGQCFNVGLPDSSINREYSVASGERYDHVDFLVREVVGGSFSPSLAQVKEGEPIELNGPYGEFTLEKRDLLKDRIVFIATGTGIAPVLSFIETYPELKCLVLHGVRSENETFFASQFVNQEYIPCVSQNGLSKFSYVQDYLSDQVTDLNAHYYLCGNQRMICEVSEMLYEKGISGDNVVSEVFF